MAKLKATRSGRLKAKLTQQELERAGVTEPVDDEHSRSVSAREAEGIFRLISREAPDEIGRAGATLKKHDFGASYRKRADAVGRLLLEAAEKALHPGGAKGQDENEFFSRMAQTLLVKRIGELDGGERNLEKRDSQGRQTVSGGYGREISSMAGAFRMDEADLRNVDVSGLCDLVRSGISMANKSFWVPVANAFHRDASPKRIKNESDVEMLVAGINGGYQLNTFFLGRQGLAGVLMDGLEHHPEVFPSEKSARDVVRALNCWLGNDGKEMKRPVGGIRPGKDSQLTEIMDDERFFRLMVERLNRINKKFGYQPYNPFNRLNQ